MPRSTRRFPSYGAAHYTEANADSEESSGKTQADPARVAVGLMLEHALAAAGTTAEAVGRDGAVCLVVLPGKCWTEVAAAEWREWVRGNERPLAGRDAGDWEDCGGWVAWTPVEKPRAHDEEGFAKAVSKGRHCLGLAADAAWLPRDLVLAADVRLDVRPLGAADVTLLAAFTCGQEPAETLDDAQAALLTPRLLRLARRPGQAADGYVRKLRGLLEAERPASAAEPAESPRDAPRLERLHGMDEAVAWAMAVKADLDAMLAGKLGGGELDRGCLLSGAPGCGKTLFARSFAATLGIPLFTGSYGQWLGGGGGHQGDMLNAMRRTFSDARAKAPSAIFIDEVDSFPNRATVTHRHADWEMQVVNALLEQIDGVEGRAGVILLAACNHPEKLDPALVRSGRLDRHIRIRLPDRAALERILREHLGADLAGEGLAGAALSASGMSGADCERVVRGARRRARQAGRPMAMGDLMAEVGGEERSAEDLRVAAVHEAGHAVAVCDLFPGTLDVISLRARGGAGGMTVSVGTGSCVHTGTLRRHLVSILAGRAAEEALLGMVSSGSGGGADSDLAQATRIAATAISALGFDADAGLVWSGMPDAAGLPRMLSANPAMAAGVRRTLDEAYADALALVRGRRAAVEALAAVLAERRVLEGAEAEAMVAEHPGADVDDVR